MADIINTDTAERRENNDTTERRETMSDYIKITLNLFDDGAGAAQAGETGAQGQQQGQQQTKVSQEAYKRGRSLGVSDELMADYEKAFFGKGKDTDGTNEGAEDAGADSAAEFESLIKGKFKDEYGKRVNKAVSDRMTKRDREISELKTQNDKSRKVLDLIASKYPSVDKNDPGALYDALMNDSDTWRQRALDEGVTSEEAKNRYKAELEQQNAKAELESLKREKAANELDRRFRTLAAETAKKYPGFDLEDEFENPRFRSAMDFIAAQNTEKNRQSGRNDEIFDITYAYEIAHADELRQGTVDRTTKAALSAAAQTIAANRNRAVENAGSTAPAPRAKSYAQMSDEEFEAALERVKSGRARI